MMASSSSGAAASSVASTSSVPSCFLEVPRKTEVKYEVHACSSSSANYAAENILIDNPSDQSSRWSSDSNTPPQFLLLRLAKMSVVTSITFGKYEKTHVCDLKRFKVLGGPDEDNLIDVLESGLKNDSMRETFRLRHTLNGQFFPIRFLKVVPIQSWGPSFNFSIWYVALAGDDSDDTVKPAIAWHEEFREREAIRLCLKHFRQHNYSEVFECLQKKTRIQLEDPLLTRLHRLIVAEGDYERPEGLVETAVENGLFDSWIAAQLPTPKWTPLILPDEILASGADEAGGQTPSASAGQTPVATPPGHLSPDDEMGAPRLLDGELGPIPSTSSSVPQSPPPPSQPGCRGGHQMLLDSASQTLYLFGGWDGYKDLNDFWSYDVAANRWRLISADTEADGGPSPRSCHKMVLDAKYRHIFILGRYLEKGLRDESRNVKSDFYMYDIAAGRWTLITDDTAAMGGPHLIFDHQMCMDHTTRTIFVFGGQTLFFPEESRTASIERRYSGLFEYHIPTNTWKKRKDDAGGSLRSNGENGMPEVVERGKSEIRSRSSHSMLFHHAMRKLFIFGGQRRRDDYLNDFFTYSVDSDDVEIISTGNALEMMAMAAASSSNGANASAATGAAMIPAVGHTQRATIDCERNEIHVMTGLNKDKDKSDKGPDSRVSNSFWVYSIAANRWTCYYKNENSSPDYWNMMQHLEPRPRYAHQLVYDDVNRVHFMFGGNPGGKQGKEDKLRLGDFWQLRLFRPTRAEVLRQCRVAIRTAHFREAAREESKLRALALLQQRLSQVVDHDDEKEERQFQLLASKLFEPERAPLPQGGPGSPPPPPAPLSFAVDPVHSLRTGLFEALSRYFPDEMTHPRSNLIDLIPYFADSNQ